MSVATTDTTGVHVTAIHVKYDGGRPASVQLNNNSKSDLPPVNGDANDGRTVTQTFTHVVQSSPGLVQSSSEVVQSSTGVVQSSTEVGQSSTEVVQRSSEVVQRSTEVVQSSSEVVQSSTEVVQSSSGVVKSSTQEVQSSQQTTQYSEQTPHISEQIPQDLTTGKSAQAREGQEPAPADSLWSTKRDGAVKLRLAANGPGSEAPYTVPNLLKQVVQKVPDGVAMAVKREGAWVKWTYTQYMADIRKAAKSFIKLGLEPYHGVGIIGFNSPEWFIADLGCIFAGGLTTGIYTTNSPEACQYVAASSESNVVVVENEGQLKKILEIRDQLPHLKAIVQYTGSLDRQAEGIYSWGQFMDLGNDVPDAVLEERIKAQSPNKCCMLIYTSGTTGNPKGVMLSHDNITWTLGVLRKEALRHLPLTYGDVCMVSYLPLSHIAAQMLDLFVVIGFGGTTYFAQPDALKGSLIDTLREVRPHVFLGVPRVWEKFQERMQTAALSLSGFKRYISRWAKGVGLKGNYAIMNGQSPPLTMRIADKLLFKKVRGLLGMDRCQMRLSGAAPITKDTLEYFMGLNQPLCEVYGMSECSGPHTSAYPKMNRVGSVGKDLTGISTVLANPDEDGNEEIVMHGRHVFMGYLNDEEKTREALDENGGLHSGDIGKKDSDGFLHITGRIKELIITAGGENVAPVPIEDMVKEVLPVVSQCMLIGDKRKFLSMILTFKVEVDPDTQEPKDTLTAVAQDWVKGQGSEVTTVSAILEGSGDRTVLQAVQRGIDRVNHRAVSNAQRIQKWSLLSTDFSIPGGELGPTMKMKRPVIHKIYAKTIDAVYEEQPASASTSASASAAVAPPTAASAAVTRDTSETRAANADSSPAVEST